MKKIFYIIFFMIIFLLAGFLMDNEPVPEHNCVDNTLITHWFTDEDGTKYSIGCCMVCSTDGEEPAWYGDYYDSGSSSKLKQLGFINDDYCEDYDYIYSKILEAIKNDPLYMSAIERNELRDNHECIDYTVYSEETYTDEEGRVCREGTCKVCRETRLYVDDVLFIEN